MDLDFQRAYGRDYLRYFGTADRWPMSVQLAVAIRGYISPGFPAVAEHPADVRPVTSRRPPRVDRRSRTRAQRNGLQPLHRNCDRPSPSSCVGAPLHARLLRR